MLNFFFHYSKNPQKTSINPIITDNKQTTDAARTIDVEFLRDLVSVSPSKQTQRPGWPTVCVSHRFESPHLMSKLCPSKVNRLMRTVARTCSTLWCGLAIWLDWKNKLWMGSSSIGWRTCQLVDSGFFKCFILVIHSRIRFISIE